ncbi:MAG: AAA family ATPase [Bdellovibrionales bacterium]|nr:AAA family ATPase [Bdellovibrionales bacterium]
MSKISDDERIQRIVEKARALSEEAQTITYKEIFNKVDNLIIGNTSYKQAISIALADFLKKDCERNHLLIVGPSGSGKTFLLEEFIPTLKIPFCKINCASLVPAGYKGTSLEETLEHFFKGIQPNVRNIVILDEFDKISNHGNGGDDFKSQSLQSELLILLSGTKESKFNTTNTLWILAGAFAYSEEAARNYENFDDKTILKYGFKNELLGRITKIVCTQLPSVDEVVKRVFAHPLILNLNSVMKDNGYELVLTDEAYLELSFLCQNPLFGMRALPKAVAKLKEHIIFENTPGSVTIDGEKIKQLMKVS